MATDWSQKVGVSNQHGNRLEPAWQKNGGSMVSIWQLNCTSKHDSRLVPAGHHTALVPVGHHTGASRTTHWCQ